MACINPDGTLVPSAQRILHALSSPVKLEEVAKSTGLPLFRIRSNIREMLGAKLIEKKEENYVVTKLGQEKIEG